MSGLPLLLQNHNRHRPAPSTERTPMTPFWRIPSLLVGLLNTILLELTAMSDSLNKLHDRVSALEVSETALAARIDAQNAKLTAAEQARDAAVADLATTKAALTDALAKIAALPNDTAALEAAVKAEIDRIDGVSAKLDGIDAAPVEAPADTSGAPASPEAPASGEAPPSPEA